MDSYILHCSLKFFRDGYFPSRSGKGKDKSSYNYFVRVTHVIPLCLTIEYTDTLVRLYIPGGATRSSRNSLFLLKLIFAASG